MIELGKYNLKDFKKLLGISEYQWKKRKDDLIDHLKLYFDFDIVVSNDNNYTFIIYQQYDEYEPLPRKGYNEKRKSYYKVLTHDILEKEPYNSGSNIARITIRDGKQYEQDAWRTVANHAREIIKEDYDKVDDHVWGYIDMNEPSGYKLLTEKQIEFLKDLFSDKICEKEMNEMSIYSQASQNIISNEEAKNKIAEYNSIYYSEIFRKFKEKYGKNPISIPKWILKEKNKAPWELPGYVPPKKQETN